MTTNGHSIPPEAIAALERGNKIEAIKIVREANTLGLKEAKDFVEQYLETNRPLKEKVDAARGCALFLVILAMLPAFSYVIILSS